MPGSNRGAPADADSGSAQAKTTAASSPKHGWRNADGAALTKAEARSLHKALAAATAIDAAAAGSGAPPAAEAAGDDVPPPAAAWRAAVDLMRRGARREAPVL